MIKVFVMLIIRLIFQSLSMYHWSLRLIMTSHICNAESYHFCLLASNRRSLFFEIKFRDWASFQGLLTCRVRAALKYSFNKQIKLSLIKSK
jgi:hypothetical protein